MRTSLRTAAVAGILLVSAVTASMRSTQTESARVGDIERGKYLVEQVAECSECHTPRKANGDLETGEWLQGATTWIRPVAPIQPWAERAPALAGLPSLSDKEMETVLEKGTGPEGEALRPPMHTYHMNPADAKAIIAYLKSLPQARH